MEQNFIENELIIFTKQTYDAFLKMMTADNLRSQQFAKNMSKRFPSLEKRLWDDAIRRER